MKDNLLVKLEDVMDVESAVRGEIALLPAGVADSGAAAVAVAMAQGIDSNKGSRSEQAKVLLDALRTLRELCPPKPERTPLDELSEKRAERIEQVKAVGTVTREHP